MQSMLGLTESSTLLLALAPVINAILGLWPYLLMLVGFSFIIFVH